MSAEGGTKAIVAAMSANLGIALVKLVAFLLSGATSMLAEAVHSAADTTNRLAEIGDFHSGAASL